MCQYLLTLPATRAPHGKRGRGGERGGEVRDTGGSEVRKVEGGSVYGLTAGIAHLTCPHLPQREGGGVSAKGVVFENVERYLIRNKC